MRFKDFQVYKDGKRLVALIFYATRKFPREFYYLSDQMNRACLSIVLNIAEGSAKKSNKDFNRYLQHSLGSATELTAALDVAKEFALLGEKEYLEIIDLISSVIKQLGGFSKFLAQN